jgi:hypothetical protein
MNAKEDQCIAELDRAQSSCDRSQRRAQLGCGASRSSEIQQSFSEQPHFVTIAYILALFAPLGFCTHHRVFFCRRTPIGTFLTAGTNVS